MRGRPLQRRARIVGTDDPGYDPAVLSTRKTKSKLSKKQAARLQRKELQQKQRDQMQVADPLSRENLKKMAPRLGIPVLLIWIVALLVPGWIPLVLALLATLVLAGVVWWAVRFARKSGKVADIVRGADTAEARKEALAKLDSEFKDDDTAAIFAKAQLQMQDDPREALATLETIKLDKVMAPMADQARSQRAMIHLMLGETSDARALVDKIDLSQHKDARMRATMAAVIGEAWARSGQAKKAVELLETFDPDDAEYANLKPQLLRALAFAYSWSSKTKQMKQVLRKMKSVNVQLLMGFITKKKNPGGVNPRGVHPSLEKEAYKMVMASGAVPRKMQVRRM